MLTDGIRGVNILEKYFFIDSLKFLVLGRMEEEEYYIL